ncbi:MAG TPA: hypothetical protein VFS65_00715 [Candidatus Saccharimonadales bacterium]|nr:hypothetical protein [Candidatus Saccharimonadales bacterium]
MATLTEDQKAVLNAEINNDPSGKGYAEMLPDRPGYVVDAINAKAETKVGIINRTDLTIWAASTGMRAVIEDVANDTQDPLRSSALAILDVLKGSSSGIDLSKPENADILTAWESFGKLSATDKNAMIALAIQPASRAEILGLPHITIESFLSRNQ